MIINSVTLSGKPRKFISDCAYEIVKSALEIVRDVYVYGLKY